MVERGSVKHGPMKDDQLKLESQPDVRGGPLAPSGPGMTTHADTPVPEVSRDEPPAEGALSAEDALARSEIAQAIPGHVMPGNRDAILAGAREMNARDAIINALSALPADREFENVQEVWEALGGDREERY